MQLERHMSGRTMHEFSLAEGLARELLRIAREHKASAVREVHVSIGALSGIVRESFSFGFEIIKEHEPMLKESQLHIEVDYPTYRCGQCGYLIERSSVVPAQCPMCNGVEFYPSGGDDLKIMRVELDLEEETSGGGDEHV